MDVTERELRSSKRWLWTILAVAAIAFTFGVRAAPPVVFVHDSSAEQHTRALDDVAGPASSGPADEESGEQDRAQMLPWLYLLKR